MNYTTSLAYTLPKSQRTTLTQFAKQMQDRPGPIYNTMGLGIKHKSFSHGIGKSQRYQINHGIQKTPSPLQYNPQKINSVQKISFAKSRVKDQVDYNPDPFCYKPNYQVNTKKVSAYSMGTKYCSIMDQVIKTPGPGAYEISSNSPKQSSKSFKKTANKMFGSTNRFKTVKYSSPGPGDYQVTSTSGFINNKGKIANGPKSPRQNEITPGPTQYNKESLFDQAIKKKLGKSISGKLKSVFDLENLTQRAFNKYQADINKLKQNLPAFSIGKSQRKVFQANKIPGPTDYITDQYQPKNTFRTIIPKSQRRQYNDIIQNPGPGAYQQVQEKHKQMTIPRSKSNAVISTNPGVGRYQLCKEQKLIGAKMGNSNRTNFISKNIAGVGDYEIQQKMNGKISIPKAQRFRRQNKNKPGPGDYHIPSTIGKYDLYYKNK